MKLSAMTSDDWLSALSTKASFTVTDDVGAFPTWISIYEGERIPGSLSVADACRMLGQIAPNPAGQWVAQLAVIYSCGRAVTYRRTQLGAWEAEITT